MSAAGLTEAQVAASFDALLNAVLPPADRITHAVRRRRIVTVHLTPHAPGCIARPPNDPARAKVFWGKTDDVVVRSLCRRLDAAPAELKAVTADNGDTEIVRLGDRGAASPLALIWDGMDAAAINVALADHVRAGWRPEEKQPQPQARKQAA